MITRLSLATMTILALIAGAGAQDYPTKTVRIIVPFSAGGVNDVVGRLLAQYLGEELKSPNAFVVENTPGAGGRRGLLMVAKAEPDGSTLGITANAPMAVQPNLYKNLPYDPVNSFTHIATAAAGTVAITITPSLPAKTLSEFVAYAKANPEKVSYGTPGVGSLPHLAAAKLQAATGIRMNHVPYSGGSAVANDLIAGHVQASFDAPLSSSPFHKAGSARILAIMDTQRNPLVPDVPTTSEAGFKNIEVQFWIGLVGPAGIPRPIVERITSAVERMVSRPDVKEALAGLDLRGSYMRPAVFTRTIVEETKIWAQVIADAGIKAPDEK